MTTSEQARADAMADAETLRRNTPRGRWDYSIHGRMETATEKAARLGADAGRIATHGHRGGDNRLNTPEFLAVEAARAAFCAVPGLRGEDESRLVTVGRESNGALIREDWG